MSDGFEDSFIVTATIEGQAENQDESGGGTTARSPKESTPTTTGQNEAAAIQTSAEPKIERVNWDAFGDQSDDLHGNKSPPPVGQEWTALGDESANALLADDDGWEDDDEEKRDTRFRRKAWSMRPTASQAVNIVTGLQRARTRSLSNASIDGETKTGRRPNTEERPLDVILRRKTWDLYLKQTHRVPGTRTYWLPITVTLQDGVISFVESTAVQRTFSPPLPLEGGDSPPLGTLNLQHSNTVTKPMVRYYDRSKRSKIHQVKIQQNTYREKRTIKRLFFIEHVSHTETVLKFGSQDQVVLQSFIDGVQEAIRQLPVTRQPGGAYRMNEVFIDIKDQSHILMNCNGAVLDRQSQNNVFVQAFLTGTPECKLVVNDIESALRAAATKGQPPLSMNQQVRMTNTVLHPCVDSDIFTNQREIVFHPIDGATFELLHCNVIPKVSPPLNVSALVEYNEVSHVVRISANFLVKKKLNLTLRPITDLVLKFPVPPAWHHLMAGTRFGKSKSVRSTGGIRGSFRRKVRNENCSVEVQFGSAKFEKAHGAIMWRIGTYHTTSLPHRFEATIRLEAGMERPDLMSQHAEVWYHIPGNSTGFSVRGLKVASTDPNKWVKYDIHYHYKVQMFPDLSID